MERFDSLDTLPTLFSISHSREDESSGNLQGYSKEFQAMLDSLVEEDVQNTTEKKRRLSVDQVKGLEKNFEAENKLEPERKAKIAEELGLQPRQVAIWFQNRRARWKNKQLEKNYAVLKADYDALEFDYNNLRHERQALTSKLRELKAKFREKPREGKEECPIPTGQEQEQKEKFQGSIMSPSSSSSIANLNGSCSSSSSSRSWVEPYRSSNYSATATLKLEEQCSVFSAEEPCNFFSVDHAPTLQWYFNGQ